VQPFHCISGDPWPDEVRLSDIGAGVYLQGMRQKGADVRPNFSWDKHEPGAAMSER
jgi:hypothetical protein